MLKSLAREPLFHFLLLGALLFLLDAWLRPTSSASAEIVVSEARVRNLAQNFQRTWQRPPTSEELAGLVDGHLREEVLYREALALGLDRDDTIVRRRLRQKVEFITEEAAALARPSDEELTRYLADHADAFSVEPRVSFTQVYLDPARRGARLDAEAKRLFDVLKRAGDSLDPTQAGDSLMLLSPRYENASQTEIARLFGTGFAQALVAQPPGKWTGPIESGYGVHLVRVESVTAGATPTLADVRPLVEREWANAKRQEFSKAFYEKLRSKYTISVQMPEAARP